MFSVVSHPIFTSLLYLHFHRSTFSKFHILLTLFHPFFLSCIPSSLPSSLTFLPTFLHSLLSCLASILPLFLVFLPSSILPSSLPSFLPLLLGYLPFSLAFLPYLLLTFNTLYSGLFPNIFQRSEFQRRQYQP